MFSDSDGKPSEGTDGPPPKDWPRPRVIALRFRPRKGRFPMQRATNAMLLGLAASLSGCGAPMTPGELHHLQFGVTSHDDPFDVRDTTRLAEGTTVSLAASTVREPLGAAAS